MTPSFRQEISMSEAFIDQFTAKIDAAYKEANRGCGLVYELFERRFQAACDGLLAQVPEQHREAALQIATGKGYTTDYDPEASFSDDGCDLTGIDPHWCPCGRHE
jgi:hypothetical protein